MIHKHLFLLFVSLVHFLFCLFLYFFNIPLIVDKPTFMLGHCIGFCSGFSVCYFIDFIDCFFDSKRNSPPSGEDKNK